MADDWKRKSVLKSCAISRTRRWNLKEHVRTYVSNSRGCGGLVRKFANEQFGGFLVAANLPERDGTRAVTMGFLDTTRGLEQSADR